MGRVARDAAVFSQPPFLFHGFHFVARDRLRDRERCREQSSGYLAAFRQLRYSALAVWVGSCHRMVSRSNKFLVGDFSIESGLVGKY